MAPLQLFNKTEKTTEDFWKEYEEQTGEKILARGLGRYVSGWKEFGRSTEMWGLIIASAGGFRFHHFPHQNWFSAAMRSGETAKEKIIFIPKEKIISAELIEESCWLRKLLKSSSPRLLINYRDDCETEQTLSLMLDFKHGEADLAKELNAG